MEIWSWILTAVGITGIYLAGSKNKLGWLIGILAQVLWLVFGLTTQQYGFIVSAFVYGFVYIRNWRRWRAEEQRPEVTKHG